VSAADGRQPRRPALSSPIPATTITFREFFEPSPRELKPSRKLLSLDGKRIRIVGYMARLAHQQDHHAEHRAPSTASGASTEHGSSPELLPDGFYLCPRPTDVAEGGGGTGDLPPNAVRVVVPHLKGRMLSFTTRPIEVVGRLELGPKGEANGQVWSIRVYAELKAGSPFIGPRLPNATP
jgi:hypothetical protein